MLSLSKHEGSVARPTDQDVLVLRQAQDEDRTQNLMLSLSKHGADEDGSHG